MGIRIDGYEEPTALKEVSDNVMAEGYHLKIYDAYRPQKGVDHFVRWAQNISDTRMKPTSIPTSTRVCSSSRNTSMSAAATRAAPPLT